MIKYAKRREINIKNWTHTKKITPKLKAHLKSSAFTWHQNTVKDGAVGMSGEGVPEKRGSH